MTQSPSPQQSVPPRLVLVDTCSLVRLYYADVKPVAGRTVGPHSLMTLEQMADEVKGLARGEDYAWLNVERLAEVDIAVVKLSKAQKKAIEQRRKNEQHNWQTALDLYCADENITHVRRLSKSDATVLAAAIELNAILVTDEWPMYWVAENFDYDNGNPIEVLLSVDVLAMLETDSIINSTERRQTYRAWKQAGELLHRNSDARYLKIFKEGAPSAQA